MKRFDARFVKIKLNFIDLEEFRLIGPNCIPKQVRGTKVNG
jgi:hypothetical protein